MKRVFSIALAMLLSLSAVQPTVVFHYCTGKLRSVALSEPEVPQHCCGKCCSDYKVTLSTDDYQPALQETIDFSNFLLQPAVFLSSGDFFSTNDSSFTYLIQHFFPPGGVAKYGFDLLRVICVFRI
ncbi:MAG: hypothetical protein LBS25_04720 [Candidatus Symbiothrix sp.]|jgi:hypothetical protein|nr:hypothetical protein [Candidatus Symbiothrix sp.]